MATKQSDQSVANIHSKFSDLRAAFRSADSKHDFGWEPMLNDYRRLLRDNGADNGQIELFSRTDSLILSAQEYLKSKNYLMATISFKDAFILEPDPVLQKVWLNKTLGTYAQAIRHFVDKKEYGRATYFAKRLHTFMEELDGKKLLTTSDSYL